MAENMVSGSSEVEQVVGGVAPLVKASEMTASQVSKRVKGWITDRTIMNWTKRAEFKPFFSARAELNVFTNDDLIVVNTIVHLRELNRSFPDIAAQLGAGFRVSELVESAKMEIPRCVETKFLNEKIEDLESRMKDEALRNDSLHSEIQELREQLGFYKGVLKIKGVDLDALT